MTEVADASNWSQLLAAGCSHLAAKEFTSAVETLANACELLAKEHGDTAYQCAEAYLWYGKSLLGLSREENGHVMLGTSNADEEEDDNQDQKENGETQEDKQNGEAEAVMDTSSKSVENIEADSLTNEEPGSTVSEEPDSSTANDAETAEANEDADESMMAVDENGEEEDDNLQLAWETLDLARSILLQHIEDGGKEAARALLADVYLALGEVALESETYDKAVIDMQSCLNIQKDLYGSDDRRIAETHYQIGLASSLASNFEDAITHFKNAANILKSRIKFLENLTAADKDTIKKLSASDPHYTIEGEIEELMELLPEIHEKIQDMMDYKAEVRPCDCLEETRKMLLGMMLKEKNRCQVECQG